MWGYKVCYDNISQCEVIKVCYDNISQGEAIKVCYDNISQCEVIELQIWFGNISWNIRKCASRLDDFYMGHEHEGNRLQEIARLWKNIPSITLIFEI